MKSIFHIIIALLLTALCQPSAAKGDYIFRTMSPDGGFYFDGVTSIEQDGDGFIWVVMYDELYRFDGHNYKKYYPHFTSIDNSKRWIFYSAICSANNEFHVNTNNGVYRYDKQNDSFTQVYGRVQIIKNDNAGNLWMRIGTTWNIFDKQTGELITPTYNGANEPVVNTVFCTYNNDLYLFINNKIYRYNYTKNDFILCLSLPQEDCIVNFAKAYKGKLWVYSNNYGLHKIDLSTLRIEGFFGFLPNRGGGSTHTLRAFYIDKYGHIWHGTMNGLFVLNPETREYSHYTHSEKDAFSLPNNSIWIINEDRQQNVWIGTYSGAISYVNIDEKNAFETYSPQNSLLSHNLVSAFAEDENKIWIGTEGGGINVLDKKTGEFDNKPHKDKLNSNNIKSLAVNTDKNIWIATYMGGLYKFNNQKLANHLINEPDNTNSLIVNSIKKIILECDSGLWIAYQNKATTISYFSLKDNKFTHITLDNENEEYIFDIVKQNENYLWAISHEKLYRLNTSTHHIDIISFNDSTYKSLYTFCMDDSGNMWIGTISQGLFKFDANTFQKTPLNAILPNSIYSIYSICHSNGCIWMGTDNGLYCYNITKNSLSRFDQEEGTQGQVYYPLAVMKSKDGRLYFGGTNGFTVVDPERISSNEHKPNVIISDFLVDHTSTKMGFSNSDNKKEITLEHDQINFGFMFSSDNYHIPLKNKFRYRLKGYDNKWHETDVHNRIALYTKVPPGVYHFEIYAANNDGLWSDIPTIITINRKPALWLSAPAYIIYITIITAMILFSLRYFHAKKKLELQLYMENVEKKKKDDIHQSQLRFFTNISHDFKTPLSLIIASLDKLRQEGLKEYYYRTLSNNAKRLLNLVNELMDFRTVENGKMKLTLQPIEINSFIKEIGEDFMVYANQRNIDFNIICDPDIDCEIYVDKGIMEKIVMNLVNNAFKYTSDGGIITVETCLGWFESKHKNNHIIKDSSLKNFFSITIRDSGIGISEESIQYVFERFHKVNATNFDSTISSGIGLALVKSFVLLHHGIISVSSEKGKGTDFSVYFSLDKDVYDKENFLETDSTTLPDNSEGVGTQDYVEEEKAQQKNRKRILIAEDNNDLRQIVTDYLHEEYDVIQAQDGLDASNILSKTTVDLIISDIMMPRKDGIALSKEVKENIETSHIPLILLTAKTSLESKIEGANSGADIYFEKPVDLQLLLLSIRNIFKQEQNLKEYYSKNYWADIAELSSNEKDANFLKQLTDIVEENLQNPEFDVNYIALKLSMSRSKLYSKIKSLTDKSIIEFILSCRLRKAARLIVEQNLSIQQVMDDVGIESPSYFSRVFKKEFGYPPSEFTTKVNIRKHK